MLLQIFTQKLKMIASHFSFIYLIDLTVSHLYLNAHDEILFQFDE